MEDDSIYIYCILSSRPQFEEQLSKSGIQIFATGEYYVVARLVSSCWFPGDNLKNNFSDTDWITPNAREHIEVITAIMKNQIVIPFKFGTIFKSIKNLYAFVNEYSASFAENFDIIEGKEEWSVKIYCNKSLIYEQISELSEEVKILEKQILESSPGRAFLLNRKRVEIVEQEVKAIMKISGQKCYDEYRTLSSDACVNNLLPHELTGREDDMILNATFFVDKQKVSDFMHTANLQRKKYSEIGLFFDVTGPCPPFSFISIKEQVQPDTRQK